MHGNIRIPCMPFGNKTLIVLVAITYKTNQIFNTIAIYKSCVI